LISYHNTVSDAMRIASSPTFRIAAGLRLAVLLGVVGNQAFRWLHSHRQDALLRRADAESWLVGITQAVPLITATKTSFQLSSRGKSHLFPSDSLSFGSDLAPIHFAWATGPFAFTEPQRKPAVTRSHEELIHLIQ
jgi:hypothetical protein